MRPAAQSLVLMPCEARPEAQTLGFEATETVLLEAVARMAKMGSPDRARPPVLVAVGYLRLRFT